MVHYFKRQVSSIINSNKDKSLNIIKKKIHDLIDEEYEQLGNNNIYRYNSAQRKLNRLEVVHYQRIKFKDGVIPLREVRSIKKEDGAIIVRANDRDHRFDLNDFDYLLEVFN